MPRPEIELSVDQEKRLRGLYMDTFGTDHGALVLEHLQTLNHVMEPSHVAGCSHETAFRDGERNTVLKIMRMIQPFNENEYRTQIADQQSQDPLADFSAPQDKE